MINRRLTKRRMNAAVAKLLQLFLRTPWLTRIEAVHPSARPSVQRAIAAETNRNDIDRPIAKLSVCTERGVPPSPMISVLE